MIQQITKGIKISVKSNFEGTFFREQNLYYAFNYLIIIENNSKDTVQLLSRKWHVLDALNTREIVEGEGVVGHQPIIPPFGRYSYRSGCHLHSPIGAMYGIYNMFNLSDHSTFEVTIPNFRLYSQFAQN